MTDNSPQADAATELIETPCDDAREVIYGAGFYGNDNDILAILVDIYCRRAMRNGADPQKALELFWRTRRRPGSVRIDPAGRRCQDCPSRL
jgi:hypothetical protein